jgi:hypothetical protein
MPILFLKKSVVSDLATAGCHYTSKWGRANKSWSANIESKEGSREHYAYQQQQEHQQKQRPPSSPGGTLTSLTTEISAIAYRPHHHQAHDTLNLLQ